MGGTNGATATILSKKENQHNATEDYSLNERSSIWYTEHSNKPLSQNDQFPAPIDLSKLDRTRKRTKK